MPARKCAWCARSLTSTATRVASPTDGLPERQAVGRGQGRGAGGLESPFATTRVGWDDNGQLVLRNTMPAARTARCRRRREAIYSTPAWRWRPRKPRCREVALSAATPRSSRQKRASWCTAQCAGTPVSFRAGSDRTFVLNADERGYARMFADRASFRIAISFRRFFRSISAAFRDHPRSSASESKRLRAMHSRHATMRVAFQVHEQQ